MSSDIKYHPINNLIKDNNYKSFLDLESGPKYGVHWKIKCDKNINADVTIIKHDEKVFLVDLVLLENIRWKQGLSWGKAKNTSKI